MKARFREANPGAMVQTAAAQTVSNGMVIEMLAAQTLKSAESGELLAKKPEIDFLLRLAGTAQISSAIAYVGAKKGRPYIVVAALSTGKVRAPRGFGGKELRRGTLSIEELEVVERGALLSAERA